jgi:hypothetical protein
LRQRAHCKKLPAISWRHPPLTFFDALLKAKIHQEGVKTFNPFSLSVNSVSKKDTILALEDKNLPRNSIFSIHNASAAPALAFTRKQISLNFQ